MNKGFKKINKGNFLLGAFLCMLFFAVSVNVFAANPGAPFSPDDNVLDPGDPDSDWGGCGPTDSNCFITTSGGASVWEEDGDDIFYTSGSVNIGDTEGQDISDYALLNAGKTFSPASWNVLQSLYTNVEGSSADYNGLVGLEIGVTNAATGAGFSEGYGTNVGVVSTNDASAQYLYANNVNLTTHDSDEAYGFIVSSQWQGNSTGGTQYGVFINLHDADLDNSYGIYQQSANKNYFAGAVGIGTTAPGAKLEVDLGVADGANPYALRLYDSTVVSEWNLIIAQCGNCFTPGTAAGDLVLRSTNSKNIHITTDAGINTALSILSTGRVGIGTAAPVATLSVNGNMTVGIVDLGAQKINSYAGTGATSGTVVGNTFRQDTTPTSASTVTNVALQAEALHHSTSTVGVSGLTAIKTSVTNNDDTTVTTVKGLEVTFGTNAGTVTDTYGVYVNDITSGTQTNTPYSFYASDANALNYFAGHVGIGTSSPGGGTILHVYRDDANTADTAGIVLEQDGAGDTALKFLLSGTRAWNVGIDNSDSDKFKIASQALSDWTDTRLAIDTSGNVGIGTTTPTGLLTVSGTTSATSWTTTGRILAVAGGTQTDTSGSGTIASRVGSSFAIPTFASSSAVTVTDATNVYIAGAAAAGTNTTLTNAYSLWVDAGNVRLDGNLILGSGTDIRPTTDAANAINIANAAGTDFVSFDTTNSFVGIGTAAPAGRLDIAGNLSRTSWTISGSALQIDAATYTDTSGSGTIASRVGTSLGIPTFASSSAVTVTDATNLYIDGAAAAGTNTTLTNAYALWVNNGSTRLDGTMTVGSNPLSTGIQGTLDVVAVNPILTISRNDTSVSSNSSIGKIQFWSNDTDLTTQNIFGNIEVLATTGIGTDAAQGYMVFRTTGTTVAGSPTERMRIDSDGNIGIGTAAAAGGRLDIAGNISRTSWTTSGVALQIDAATYTDTSGSGTVASRVGSSFGTPTFTSSSAVTVTDATNFYISAAPTAGTNTTFTNSYALWVDSGNTRLDGKLTIGTPPSTGIQGDLDVLGAGGAGGTLTLSRNDTSLGNESLGKIQFWGNDTELTTQNIFGNIEVFSTSTVSTDAAAGYMVFRTTGTTAGGSPTERMRIDQDGNVGIGATASARLDIAGNFSSSSWTTSGAGLEFNGGTYTDTSGSGTIASRVAYSFSTPTFASSNSVTVTDASSFYISAAPTAGTNTAFTNSYALWVDAGNTRLDGNLTVGTPPSTGIQGNLDVIGSGGGGAVATLSRNDTLVGVNDSIGKIQFWNNEADLTTQNIFGNIEVMANSTIASDAAQGYMVFRTTDSTVAGSPVERMRITAAGSIGMTMPGTQNTVALCHSTDGTGGVASTNFVVDCSGAPSDIAEWYETEANVEVADVVSASNETITFEYATGIGQVTDSKGNKTDEAPLGKSRKEISVLKKSTNSDTILGVVSTAPYQTFGEDVKEVAQHPQRVALVGRVPVKFSTENGEVVPGDRLTVSATMPGYSMKMISSGQSLGIVLEPSISNKVLAFINLSYQITNEDLASWQSIETNLDSLLDDEFESDSFAEQFFQRLSTWLGDVTNGITKFFAKEIETNKICVSNDAGESTCITKEELDELLLGNAITPSQNENSEEPAHDTEEETENEEEISEEIETEEPVIEEEEPTQETTPTEEETVEEIPEENIEPEVENNEGNTDATPNEEEPVESPTPPPSLPSE